MKTMKVYVILESGVVSDLHSALYPQGTLCVFRRDTEFDDMGAMLNGGEEILEATITYELPKPKKK